MLDGKPLSQEQLHIVHILLTIFVIAVIMQILITVTGFIGIFKLNLRALYFYTGCVVIQTIIGFASFIVSTKDIGYSGIHGNIAVLCMMYFLITELRKANHLS